VYLFNEGTHSRLYDKLGAHVLPGGGGPFAVWAPNAQYVSVIGDFNVGTRAATRCGSAGRPASGMLTVPERGRARTYKYHVASRYNGYVSDRVDPFGFLHGTAPRKESIVHQLDYQWADADWMAARGARQKLDKPMSIYEMHLGSWMRVPEQENRWLTYRELAPLLGQYLTTAGSRTSSSCR
jgi:1,4-alpha-glucan branching enzyme